MNYIFSISVILLSIAQQRTAGIEKLSQECKNKLFPVTSGGGRDEKVSCTLYDEKNKLIIVAGNSTSIDYVAGTNDHAFAYALDLDGNWIWGKSFYKGNQFNPQETPITLSTISGCNFDKKGNLITLGLQNSKPTILEIDSIKGKVIRIITINDSQDQFPIPWYQTYQALHHEALENDGNSYYYTAFIKQDILEVLKFNSETLDVKWNYNYFSKDQPGQSTSQNLKIPAFLVKDPNNNSRMYLIGQFYGRASFMKFDIDNMNLDWQLQFKEEQYDPESVIGVISEIYSYSIPKNKNFILSCGYWAIPDQYPHSRNSIILKVNEQGKLTGSHIFRFQEFPQDDSCRAVTYDEAKNQAVFFIKASQLTEKQRSNSTMIQIRDMFIVTMNDLGDIVKTYTIDLGQSLQTQYKFDIGTHSIFTVDGQYVLGAFSNFAVTKEQSYLRQDLDSHVFKFDLETSQECFYFSEIELNRLSTYYDMNHDKISVYDANQRDLFKQRLNQFKVENITDFYELDLGQSIKFPKMCATISYNMTFNENYYIAQNPYKYSISRETKLAPAVLQMEGQPTWLFENGTNAEGPLGNFSRFENGGTFNIYTNTPDEIKREVDAEGLSKTILRGCSAFDELIELYLYVNVRNNSVPWFNAPLTTTWYLEINQTIDYYMPQPIDNENNDELVVDIVNITDKPGPSFVNLYKLQDYQILKFTPSSIWDRGRKFYFQVVLKEKNSEIYKLPFNCTVTVLGAKIDRDLFLKYKDRLALSGIFEYDIEGIYPNDQGGYYFLLKNNTLFDLENNRTMNFDLNFNVSNTQTIQVLGGSDPFLGVILKNDGSIDLFFYNKTRGFIQIEESMTLENMASLLENDLKDIFGIIKSQNTTIDKDKVFFVDQDNKLHIIDIYSMLDQNGQNVLEMSFQPIDLPLINVSKSDKDFSFIEINGQDWVVSTSPNKDTGEGKVVIYDIQTGKVLFELDEYSENVNIEQTDEGFVLYLDGKMIIYQFNSTTNQYQKYEFDFEWPVDGDFTNLTRCNFNQIWNEAKCQDCPQFYGSNDPTGRGKTCQHCSYLWNADSLQLNLTTAQSQENSTSYLSWDNYVAWNLCSMSLDELYRKNNSTNQVNVTISQISSDDEEDVNETRIQLFSILTGACVFGYCGAIIARYFYKKNQQKVFSSQLKLSDEGYDIVLDETKEQQVPFMDAKEIENEKNHIDYELYLYELEAAIDLIKQEIDKEVKMQSLKMKDKAISRYLQEQGHHNLSLKERAALRRKAKLLKKLLDQQGINEVFDNIDFQEFVTKEDAQLDEAEKELGGKDDDSGLRDYLQMLLQLENSLEIVRQNIEKEVKMQNLILKDKAIQRYLGNKSLDSMNLRERAALRRKARLLKQEILDQKMSGIFDDIKFQDFVTQLQPELDKIDRELNIETQTSGEVQDEDKTLKITPEEQIKMDFYKQMNEIEEFQQLANLQIDAEIKMQSLRFKERMINRHFQGQTYQNQSLAKRAALRKKANMLKKELKEKDTKFEGFLDKVQYDEKNPFKGEVVEVVEKKEKFDITQELEKIAGLPQSDQKTDNTQYDYNTIMGTIQDVQYFQNQAEEVLKKEQEIQRFKLNEKKTQRIGSMDRIAQVYGLQDKARKRKEQKLKKKLQEQEKQNVEQKHQVIEKSIKTVDDQVKEEFSTNHSRDHTPNDTNPILRDKTPTSSIKRHENVFVQSALNQISEKKSESASRSSPKMNITQTGSFFRPQNMFGITEDQNGENQDQESDEAELEVIVE